MSQYLTRRLSVLAVLAIAIFVLRFVDDAIAGELPQERLAKAEAMFQERCKTAGEKIIRAVENVEGIYLMKIRPEVTNYGSQYDLTDPYGDDVGGEGYVRTFLLGRTQQGSLVQDNFEKTGYRFVEAVDAKDGRRYRYTGAIKVVGKKDAGTYNNQVELRRDPNFDLNIYAFVIDKAPVSGAPPRYGVTYDDISTRDERDYWIAGSSLRVIDLNTNEVIAERVGYMMDRRQGDRSGSRSPWLLASSSACPSFPGSAGNQPVQIGQSRFFVEKVLRINRGK